MGWIKDNVDAYNKYRRSKDKFYTAEAYLNNAELGGNEEGQAMAQRDLEESAAERKRARNQLLFGSLSK